METTQQQREQRKFLLEKGQMWKLEHGYLRIVELGKRHVHYQILRQLHQHVATPRLIGIVQLIIYLWHNEAKLMNERNGLGTCLT
jgi:hypothetical protein